MERWRSFDLLRWYSVDEIDSDMEMEFTHFREDFEKSGLILLLETSIAMVVQEPVRFEYNVLSSRQEPVLRFMIIPSR